MVATDERVLLRRARERLDEWTFTARDRAYDEFFAGENARTTADELALVDRIDSDLTRLTGNGLWDGDSYGVVAPGVLGTDRPAVVCVYHPEIPFEGYRGAESLDEETRQRLNDVLWEYSERVASIVEEDLAEFVRRERRDAD